MVAGHILEAVDVLHHKLLRGRDPRHRRRPAVPPSAVMCHQLPPWVKWAFWWTNAPYWVIAWTLMWRSLPPHALQHPVHECLRSTCGSGVFHALCVGLVALASSAFHGAQLNLDRSVCACQIMHDTVREVERFTGLPLTSFEREAPVEVGSVMTPTRLGVRRRSGRLNAKRLNGSPRAHAGGAPNGLNDRLMSNGDEEDNEDEALCQYVDEAPPGGGAIAGVTGASPARRSLVAQLMLCDVLCANVYVVFLLSCIGAKAGHLYEIAEAGAVPVGCLFIAAASKRKGWYHGYVVFHSAWHLLSALLMYEMLYDRFGDSW